MKYYKDEDTNDYMMTEDDGFYREGFFWGVDHFDYKELEPTPERKEVPYHYLKPGQDVMKNSIEISSEQYQQGKKAYLAHVENYTARLKATLSKTA